MIVRVKHPAERLATDHFDRPMNGCCHHCSGAVKIYRDDCLRLINRASCLKCGQRYYVEYDDLETFMGYSPALEGIDRDAWAKPREYFTV